VDGINNCTSLGKIHTLTDTKAAANPTSVDEPNFSVVLLALLSKHLSILVRMQGQESLTKAGGEGGNWVNNAHFSAGDL